MDTDLKYIKIPIWESVAPFNNNITENEFVENCFMIRNIKEAEMYVYFPHTKNCHVATLICAGGGYLGLALWIEGESVARALNEMGITAIVLKYRLPNFHPEVPLSDAQQAMRIIRAHAKQWNIDSNKIGILGFSAGGHVASFTGTHFNDYLGGSQNKLKKISSRPDFMGLIYPVITMQEYTHLGSRLYLMGENPSQEMKNYYSNEMHVTSSTPPSFIVVTEKDETVDPQNSYQFNLALQRKNVPVELNIFKLGDHGFGISDCDIPVCEWHHLFYDWLLRLKIIEN